MCVLEVLREPRVDRRRVVGRLEEVDAFGREQRAQQLAPARRPVVEHAASARWRIADELLLGVQAVGRHVLDAGAELLQQRRDPHHEELVEVGAGDAEELDALEQRMRRVLRLREDALVERQPAQLAVDVQRRIVEVGRRGAAARLLSRVPERRWFGWPWGFARRGRGLASIIVPTPVHGSRLAPTEETRSPALRPNTRGGSVPMRCE